MAVAAAHQVNTSDAGATIRTVVPISNSFTGAGADDLSLRGAQTGKKLRIRKLDLSANAAATISVMAGAEEIHSVRLAAGTPIVLSRDDEGHGDGAAGVAMTLHVISAGAVIVLGSITIADVGTPVADA